MTNVSFPLFSSCHPYRLCRFIIRYTYLPYLKYFSIRRKAIVFYSRQWVRTSMTSYVQNLHRNSTSEFWKNSCFFTDRHKICEKSTQEVYQGIFCTQEVNLGIPMCCMVEFLCEFLCTKCTQEVIDVRSQCPKSKEEKISL